jgi:PilZ domain-containing protein
MDSTHPRRYPRYHMHTPVFIPVPGTANTVVPGLVSKLSRAGMELYAGVNLQPGELMEVEFRIPGRTIRVVGTVCYRSGFCFGLAYCDLRIELEKAADADSVTGRS